MGPIARSQRQGRRVEPEAGHAAIFVGYRQPVRGEHLDQRGQDGITFGHVHLHAVKLVTQPTAERSAGCHSDDVLVCLFGLGPQHDQPRLRVGFAHWKRPQAGEVVAREPAELFERLC